jgi:hypothetical protein
MLPLTLPRFPPFSAWTWITSTNIIDVFHLGLLHLHSYHQISYVHRINVQHVLHIPLSRLTFDLSYVIAWHFLKIPFFVFGFFSMGW